MQGEKRKSKKEERGNGIEGRKGAAWKEEQSRRRKGTWEEEGGRIKGGGEENEGGKK